MSTECERIVASAVEEANSRGDATVETPHILMAVLEEEASLAAEILRDHAVDALSFIQQGITDSDELAMSTIEPDVTGRLKRVAERWSVVLEDTLETSTSVIAFSTQRSRPVVLKVLRNIGDEWRSGSDIDKPAAAVSGGTLGQLGSIAAYHLNIRIADPTPEHRFRREPLDETVDLFVDRDTLFVIRSQRTLISTTDLHFRVPSIMDYSDYRTVDGRAVPFRIVERVGTAALGIRQTTFTIQTVQFNAGVSDSAFLPQC